MKKKLILVAAPPASGKNRVCDALAARLHPVTVLDKDDLAPLVNRLFDATGNDRDMDGAFYGAHIRDAEYETLFRLAEAALRHMDLVFVNAPLGREIRDPAFLSSLRARIREAGAGLYVIWLLADPQVCRERMLRRAAPRDAGKLRDWDAYVRRVRYDPPVGLVEAGAADALFLFDTLTEAGFSASLDAAVSLLSDERQMR